MPSERVMRPWFNRSRMLILLVTSVVIVLILLAINTCSARLAHNRVLLLKSKGARIEYARASVLKRGREVDATKFLRDSCGLQVWDFVGTVDVKGFALSDTEWRAISTFWGVSLIYFDGSNLSDECLYVLNDLKHICHAEFGNTGITDDGLRYFVERHPNLRSAGVFGTRVSDKCILDLEAQYPLVDIDRTRRR